MRWSPLRLIVIPAQCVFSTWRFWEPPAHPCRSCELFAISGERPLPFLFPQFGHFRSSPTSGFLELRVDLLQIPPILFGSHRPPPAVSSCQRITRRGVTFIGKLQLPLILSHPGGRVGKLQSAKKPFSPERLRRLLLKNFG